MPPPVPTVVGFGFPWLFQFIGQLAFQWIPGTVSTIGNTVAGSPGGVPYPAPPLTEPATAAQVTNYLQAASLPGAWDWLYHAWGVWVAISILLSLVFAAIVVYCVVRLLQVRKHERLKFEAAQHPIVSHDVPRVHLRWEHIMREIQSDDEQSWRLAILEADIMLNELLDMLGYKGDTMADKMRQVDRINFNTIDQAWEAHRARNAVAHEGTAAHLDARQARRVISLYQNVFREFHFVP